MKQFVDDHFAVIVVLVVFFALFAAYLLELHLGPRATNTLDWLEGEMKEVIGAVLMGLTGRGAVAVINGNRKTDTPAPLPEAK
jgi:hypothetical protein